MKGDGSTIDELENVICTLDAKKRNCRRGKNRVDYADLRDAIYYLEHYQLLCKALGRAITDSGIFSEDEENYD